MPVQKNEYLMILSCQLFFILLVIVSLLFVPRSESQAETGLNMKLRHGTASDLDSMTTLGLAALPDDPIWPYRFPLAKQYPDEHYKYSRIRFSEYLDNVEAGIYAAVLIETPSMEDPSVTAMVAMSLWVLPGHHTHDANENNSAYSWAKKEVNRLGPSKMSLILGCGIYVETKPPSDHPERPDANQRRMTEFRKQLKAAKASYFDDAYGDSQLNLMILATHPKYRRHGAALKLMQWGMDKAEQEHAALTLFSSPMGLPLYSKLGFTTKTLVQVQVEGEEEKITLPAMSWIPPSGVAKPSSGSIPEAVTSWGLTFWPSWIFRWGWSR
jgi:GNAT superfamily N-acetyltransferase